MANVWLHMNLRPPIPAHVNKAIMAKIVNIGLILAVSMVRSVKMMAFVTSIHSLALRLVSVNLATQVKIANHVIHISILKEIIFSLLISIQFNSDIGGCAIDKICLNGGSCIPTIHNPLYYCICKRKLNSVSINIVISIRY